MITLRPHHLFRFVQGDRDVTLPIPSRPGLGGLSLLETFVLIAAGRIVKARRAFEIGTFLGRTTLALAQNLQAEILTLDLDDAASVGEQLSDDAEVMQLHFAAPKLDFVGTACEARIAQLLGNSTTFDFSPWKGAVDLVFIDGGHDVATAASDTKNAFALVEGSSSAAILWHDYANPDYPELSAYLDDLSRERTMLHVGDTMLCLWFSQEYLSASILGAGR